MGRSLCQLSLEFMVYLSVSGLALLFAAWALTVYAGKLSSAGAAYQNQSFLWQLSAAMYSGYSSFRVYVPPGVCAPGAPSNLTPQGSSYYLPGALEMDRSAICPSGRTENLTMASDGNGWVLE